jgi:hypothetical protein
VSLSGTLKAFVCGLIDECFWLPPSHPHTEKAHRVVCLLLQIEYADNTFFIIYDKFMKILVLSSFSQNIADLNKLSSIYRDRYCRKHGYEFENLEIDYSKHLFVLNLMRDRLNNYDIVMNMGCDTAFTNHDIRIEDMAVLHDPRPVISREEFGNNPINNDVMIWKKTPECIDLLSRIIDEEPQWINHKWLWQNHLAENYMDKLVIMPARHMNSTFYPYRNDGGTLVQDNCESSWQAGDWVIHALGFPTKTRALILKWAIQKATNIGGHTNVSWID